MINSDLASLHDWSDVINSNNNNNNNNSNNNNNNNNNNYIISVLCHYEVIN